MLRIQSITIVNHIIMCVLFINLTDFGAYGIGIATSITYLINLILAILIGYKAKILKYFKFSRHVDFRNFKKYIKLGLYNATNDISGLMSYECLIIFSG